MNDYPDTSSEDREVSALSLPPHSMEAEQSVLGGLLLENSAWDRIADVVTGEDFYRFRLGTDLCLSRNSVRKSVEKVKEIKERL